MTPADLESELRALLAVEAKATPGPWEDRHRHPDPDCAVRYVRAPALGGDEVCTTYNTMEENVANTALIAASRNALRPLVEVWLRQLARHKPTGDAPGDVCNHCGWLWFNLNDRPGCPTVRAMLDTWSAKEHPDG